MPELINPEASRIKEIEELERQLAEKKAAINIETSINRTERKAEISRENISEQQTQMTPPTNINAYATPSSSAGVKTDVQQDVKSIANMEESRKVETLVAIALDKGITHCIEVANSLQDPYILDTLHDKLLGELHDRLVKENKLKDL